MRPIYIIIVPLQNLRKPKDQFPKSRGSASAVWRTLPDLWRISPRHSRAREALWRGAVCFCRVAKFQRILFLKVFWICLIFFLKVFLGFDFDIIFYFDFF